MTVRNEVIAPVAASAVVTLVVVVASDCTSRLLYCLTVPIDSWYQTAYTSMTTPFFLPPDFGCLVMVPD
jgi:hypothetical protein